MVKDVEMYAKEDEKRKNVADVKAKGEQVIALVEKTLKEDKEKGAPQEDLDRIKKAMDELRRFMFGENVEEITQNTLILQQAVSGQAGDGNTYEEPVPEADYEDVGESKEGSSARGG